MILPLFPRCLQFPISLGLNLVLILGEHVLRRDVPDGPVQTNVVVMLHGALTQASYTFPGRYSLTAIDLGWDLEWTNWSILKPYLPKGQTLKISANDQKKVVVEMQHKM